MFGTLARDRRGGITILAAAGLLVMIGGAAMAIDLGAVFADSRRLQGIADAAALAAAATPASMTAEARAAVDASGWARPVATQVTAGRWSAAAVLADRFIAGAALPNAARVTASATTPLFFARVFGLAGVPLRRSATATRIDQAGFSIGSRLLALDGGIANRLLGSMLGIGTLSLSVMDYQALASADVDLLAFADALRVQGGAAGLSYDRVLATSIRMPQALAALASVLDGNGASGAATAVRRIASAATGTPALTLSQLIDLGPIGAQDRAASGQAIRVDAFDLVRSMASAAGGPRTVQLDLGATIPGLASTKAWLAIGDRIASSPWVTVTASGDPIVRTAQTRLYLEGSIAPPALLTGATAVTLPVYVELAEAQARLSRITCSAGERRVELLALPSPGHASIADVDTDRLYDQRTALTETPARLATLVGAVGLTAQTRIDLASGSWQTVAFTTSEVAARATKTISSGGTVTALAQSLVSQVSVSANVGGIAIANPVVTGAAKGAIVTIAPLLDGVVASLTNLLGIHLGQADLRIDGLRCGQAALVA